MAGEDGADAPDRSLSITFVGINHAPEPTGIGPYTTGMARALAWRGHRVTVVTSVPHYPAWQVMAGYGDRRTAHELVDGVQVVRLRHRIPSRPTMISRSLMEVAFGLRALTTDWAEPDVVVLVSPALLSCWLVRLRARLTRAPVIVWVQDIYTLGVQQTGGSARLGNLLRHIESQLLRGAATVVAIHTRFRRYLVHELRVPADRISVIRNWSHVEAPEPDPDRRAALRARHGWQPDDLVVLHAGNMGAKQGLQNVVEASALAHSEGSTVRFVLLGDGNQRAALDQLGGNSRLQFLSPVPDAEFTATLAAADVLLVNELPGLTEMSVPSKLTSYFATGLPVLGAVDAGSITADELAAAGDQPRVPAGDPAALLAAAEDLGRDPERRRALGRAGRAFRSRHLTEDRAVAAFCDALRSVTRSAVR
ncbi:glycosyltransferase [Microlunatus sp. Y2014]|uniref:glycosyltransferase n=1 Tax=Microlunatus sp. Y2014 TaxID=3418488 RepID=UPI003DA752CF